MGSGSGASRSTVALCSQDRRCSSTGLRRRRSPCRASGARPAPEKGAVPYRIDICISVNEAVIELLQEHVGILENRKPTLHHDLDKLAGSWRTREAKAFER